MATGSHTRDIRLAVAAGPQTDDSIQTELVSDIRNMVISPKGHSLVCRGGLEVRNHYNVYGVPAGKKVILKETAPPDVALGNEFLIINPTYNNRVEEIAFTRDRTQLEGTTLYTTAGFDISANAFAVSASALSVPAPYNNDLDIGYIVRTGDLSRATALRVSTVNGTAIGGTDFSAVTNFAYGIAANIVQGSFVTVRNLNCAAGKFFYIQFVLGSTDTTTMLGTVTRITITMV